MCTNTVKDLSLLVALLTCWECCVVFVDADLSACRHWLLTVLLAVETYLLFKNDTAGFVLAVLLTAYLNCMT